MDVVVGRNADEVLVEGAVVDRAEAQTVLYDGLAASLGVADDVRRVEQPHLPERADRAAVVVRGEHESAEAPLVEPRSTSRTA